MPGGSLAELETQLTIANNLGYINEAMMNRVLDQSGERGRILNGLLSSLRQ